MDCSVAPVRAGNLTAVNMPAAVRASLGGVPQSMDDSAMAPLPNRSRATLAREAIPLAGDPADYDPLLEMVASRPLVMLGESTHGTHDFYAMRADISRRLIEEKGFDAVLIEGDWPQTQRLNDFVAGSGDDTALEAFADFRRFPAWMWRNQDMLGFVAWLRDYNCSVAGRRPVRLHGMDLYSLYQSAQAVIEHLEQVDPGQASEARRLYVALDHVRDPQRYGYEASAGLRPDCQEAAVALLANLVRIRSELPPGRNGDLRDDHFSAERNAAVLLSAERYYRAMFSGRTNTWNLRDSHMAGTLFALRRHLRASGREGKIVVWAHNSHVGDSRATQMGERGEWNLGQLAREQLGPDNVLLVGFTTYTGQVIAARDWDAPAERRWVRPAHADSYEALLHATGCDRFFLPLLGAAADAVEDARLERAIGVVYRPDSELASHYFSAQLASQFDAVFHLDQTSALVPLDEVAVPRTEGLQQTFPSGL